MKLFKILTLTEYSSLPKSAWRGTAFDQSDGFIHLSTRSQLNLVVEYFFSNQHKLVVLEFDDDFENLRWETGEESSQVFPHLYGDLDLRLKTAIYEIVKINEKLNIDAIIPNP